MIRFFLCALAGVVVLTSCSSNDFGPDSDKEPAPAPDPGTITYQATIKPIITNNCLSCHGEFGNLNGVKSNITEILRRIQLAPGSNDFMPKGGSKLSADKIQAFKTWQQNGYPD